MGTASGDLFVEFNNGQIQSFPIAGAGNGGALYFGVTDHERTIDAVWYVLRNGGGDIFSLDDFSYVGTCSGRERFRTTCTNRRVVRTTVTSGVPGGFIEAYMDGMQRRQCTFGAQGKARMKWAEGAHVIRAITGCGLESFDFVYCGTGACTGNEALSRVECDEGQKVTARVVAGVPGEVATLYLDGDPNQVRLKDFNRDGNVNVTWPNAGSGEHMVTAVMTCGTVLQDAVDCGGQDCTGDEVMFADYDGSDVSLEIHNGVPGRPVRMVLDGMRPRNRTFDQDGFLRTSWADVPVGSHQVTRGVALRDHLRTDGVVPMMSSSGPMIQFSPGRGVPVHPRGSGRCPDPRRLGAAGRRMR